MKALSLIALAFAAFLIFLGLSSRQTAGNVLSNAIIIGGTLIAVFVIIVWIAVFFKEKKDSDKDSDS